MELMREEDAEFFLCCISCQNRFPGHFCVITPERPSPCGITYEQAMSRIEFFKKVKPGRKLGVDEYEGLNSFAKTFGCERVKLHSVSRYPHPTSPLQQIIAFVIPDEGIGLVDRSFRDKTPAGLTFEQMSILSAGRQVDGFTGVSFAYLKSRKFLCGEGGWKAIVWASPKVQEFCDV